MKKDYLNSTVIVCALGYFVDIYDLVLFGIVRIASLKDIGVPQEKLLDVGVLLLNMQMIGMLVGGLLWGILGDKKGRLTVLFGSILMYSLANIANAFVETVPQYALLRFIAGVGLAGELGAAITLVSEILPKESRGIGTTIVASVGICGAILAGIVGDLFHWKTAYIVGGVLGLLLLFLRMGTIESSMFDKLKTEHKHIKKGDFLLIFKTGERLKRYLFSILIGVPIWYVIGILVTFSPELAQDLGVTGPVKAAYSILFAYVGLALGDLASGLLSQKLKSRKKVLRDFLFITAASIIIYFLAHEISPTLFYGLCLILGFGTGYWALFVSQAAEQFGTNLRSTVTTTVPNFVRGAVVPLTFLFQFFHNQAGLGRLASAALVGVLSMAIALYALTQLKETFAKDLDYHE